MKYTIEFDDDEKDDFEVYFNAYKYKHALDEIMELMRKITKYGDNDFKDKEHSTVEKLREKFIDIINQNDLLNL